MSRPTLFEALTESTSPVCKMILLDYASIPSHVVQWAKADIGKHWTEVYQPTNVSSEGACRYGCKVYARRRGAVIEFGLYHSRTYGHGQSDCACRGVDDRTPCPDRAEWGSDKCSDCTTRCTRRNFRSMAQQFPNLAGGITW